MEQSFLQQRLELAYAVLPCAQSELFVISESTSLGIGSSKMIWCQRALKHMLWCSIFEGMHACTTQPLEILNAGSS